MSEEIGNRYAKGDIVYYKDQNGDKIGGTVEEVTFDTVMSTYAYKLKNHSGWFTESILHPVYTVEKSEEGKKERKEMVNHPAHYNSHPSGVECIEIIRHYTYDVGAAIKYLWRCGLKEEEGMTLKEKEIEDLEKAIWHIQDRIDTLKKDNHN